MRHRGDVLNGRYLVALVREAADRRVAAAADALHEHFELLKARIL